VQLILGKGSGLFGRILGELATPGSGGVEVSRLGGYLAAVADALALCVLSMGFGFVYKQVRVSATLVLCLGSVWASAVCVIRSYVY